MLTLRNELARAVAQVIAHHEPDLVTTETLRAGLRFARCLLDAAAADAAEMPGIVASLGEDPVPARLERHARGALAAGYGSLRQAGGASPEECMHAMADGAMALAEFSRWTRHSGFHDLAAKILEVSLAAWPAEVRSEDRLWVAYRGATSDVVGLGGGGTGPHALEVAAALEAQVQAAHLPALLPLAGVLRGLHESNCGRFGEAERLARSAVRRGKRSGDRRVEAAGLFLATNACGRQGRSAEAAGFALQIVRMHELAMFERVLALINVGVAFQAMGLFDPSLEAYAASFDWFRRSDRFPTAFVRVLVLRQVMELYALRGIRGGFLELYHQLDATPLTPYDRVFFHRDAATGFMRFGESDIALAELRKAQRYAEQRGFHYDWFAIEAEIQQLRNVHSQGRDVAHLERSHAELVQNARAVCQVFETSGRVLTARA